MDLPAELLLDNSNIGQKGKWLFRVDQAEDIGRCPAGLLSPPLCQQDCPVGTWGFDCESKCHCADGFPCDFSSGFCSNNKCAKGYTGSNCYEDVDECALDAHNCSEHATCLNSRGSYDCKCNENYYGNGFNCTVVDKCFVRFGEYCSGNARCDDSSPEAPQCVCNDGFHGDGLICLQVQVEGSPAQKTTIRVPPPRPPTKAVESGEEETPFVMKEWVTDATNDHSTRVPPRKIEQPVGKDYHDVDNEVLSEGHEEDSQADMASLNLLLAIFVFGAVWLVVMVVVVAVYCYKRTRSRKLDSRLPAAWRPDAYRSMNSNFFMAPPPQQGLSAVGY
uniref:EGF-like domain-containing protein n=1 Tax=Steinernema glaseri TaxID=37863 RepID=A0A1I7ZKE1_9BILA